MGWREASRLTMTESGTQRGIFSVTEVITSICFWLVAFLRFFPLLKPGGVGLLCGAALLCSAVFGALPGLYLPWI